MFSSRSKPLSFVTKKRTTADSLVGFSWFFFLVLWLVIGWFSAQNFVHSGTKGRKRGFGLEYKVKKIFHFWKKIGKKIHPKFALGYLRAGNRRPFYAVFAPFIDRFCSKIIVKRAQKKCYRCRARSPMPKVIIYSHPLDDMPTTSGDLFSY